MMKHKRNNDELEILWVKIGIYSIIIVLCLVFFILAPKRIFAKDMSFTLATSLAVTSDESLLLYDYEVYSNMDRFNQGLIDDVTEVKLAFRERSEIVAVKIYGETASIEKKDDYIFIVSPDVPELNIEYYMVKDINFDGTNLPVRTFIMLFDDVSLLVNNIYFTLLTVISLAIIFPVSIKLTRILIFIKKSKKHIES